MAEKAKSKLGGRRIVVACHWADDPDLDALTEALEPLKAPGTIGYAVTFHENDPVGVEFYTHMKELHDADTGEQPKNG